MCDMVLTKPLIIIQYIKWYPKNFYKQNNSGLGNAAQYQCLWKKLQMNKS